jgi:hypothetical protein
MAWAARGERFAVVDVRYCEAYGRESCQFPMRFAACIGYEFGGAVVARY